LAEGIDRIDFDYVIAFIDSFAWSNFSWSGSAAPFDDQFNVTGLRATIDVPLTAD
jgi:hypothetical protein